MARFNRRTRRRSKRSTRNMRSIKSRKGASAQQRQLASLQRQVRRNANKLKEVTQHVQYSIPLTGTTEITSALTDGAFDCYSLVRPNQWGPIFQTNALTGAGNALTAPNKVRLTRMDLQMVFSPGDSLATMTPRIVRVWVVKLKPETANQTLEATVGMSGTGINAHVANHPGDLFYTTPAHGALQTMVKLNPAAFNIMAYREFTLANTLEETIVTPGGELGENNPLSNTFDALKRVRIHMKISNVLKVAMGSWREMEAADVMPNDRYYLLTHVGGFGGGELNINAVRMDTNIVVQGRSSN